jgi:hypothetical protein
LPFKDDVLRCCRLLEALHNECGRFGHGLDYMNSKAKENIEQWMLESGKVMGGGADDPGPERQLSFCTELEGLIRETKMARHPGA